MSLLILARPSSPNGRRLSTKRTQTRGKSTWRGQRWRWLRSFSRFNSECLSTIFTSWSTTSKLTKLKSIRSSTIPGWKRKRSKSSGIKWTSKTPLSTTKTKRSRKWTRNSSTDLRNLRKRWLSWRIAKSKRSKRSWVKITNSSEIN